MAINIPNNFAPREYQMPTLKAFDQGYKRIYLIWHRRAGKDKTCFSLLAKAAATRVGTYYYVFPTYRQGKKALWDNRDAQGFKTLEHLPRQLWKSDNNVEMKIELLNGSIIQIVGSDNVDSLVGTNPVGIVYSEWALQNPSAFDYMQPIVEENNGFIIFNTTPRGDNHAKVLFEMAKQNPAWYTSLLTVNDTNVFDEKQLKRIRNDYIQRHGNDAIYQQEFYCSFDTPIPGAIFGDQMRMITSQGHISHYEYNPSLPVYTGWDLGAGDATVIWFFQVVGNTKIFIDYHESYGGGMKFYYDLLQSKGYTYAQHLLPHDADAIVQGMEAKTRKQMLTDLGLGGIKVVKRVRIKQDAIELARMMLPTSYFDEEKCAKGITALREYARIYSDEKKTFSAEPEHNWASHPADGYMTIAQGFDSHAVHEAEDPNLLVKPTYYTW